MALKKWKFEPFFQGGRPVPVEFIYKVNFNPEAKTQKEAETEGEPEKPESYSQELVNTLHKCAEYCQKLNEAALNFICIEKAHDIYYGPDPKQSNNVIALARTITLGDRSKIVEDVGLYKPYYGSWKIKRNNYVSDYILVKKGQEIKEKRVLLKENGRQVPAQKEFLRNERFSGLKPSLAPSQVLGKDRQELFSFSIIKEKENLYEIEAVPVSRYAGGIEHAKIWVDKQNFQVLKMEVKGVPLEGYNEVLKETTKYNLKPEFITVYSYEMEKEGLLFPDKVKVRVRYPIDQDATVYKTKIKTDINYKDYQFFIVKTEVIWTRKRTG